MDPSTCTAATPEPGVLPDDVFEANGECLREALEHYDHPGVEMQTLGRLAGFKCEESLIDVILADRPNVTPEEADARVVAFGVAAAVERRHHRLEEQ